MAAAQDTNEAGAQRVEIGVFPAGGTFFTQGSSGSEASFKNYALGASVTANISRFVGLEGEIGEGIGFKQTIDFSQISVPNLTSPSTFAYNGNVAWYPGGKDHAFVPYVTGGLGGLTIRARDELATFDLTRNTTFLTENFGGGVKWFANRVWGLRADYRYIMVNKSDSADPFFGLNDSRVGHRVYGSVVFTFGQ
jgi:opacity protein-like surface antigen